MEWAYDDSYQSVVNDPRVLEDQRTANLLDQRFYVAETALQRAASETGLVSTGQKISINGWNYARARRRRVDGAVLCPDAGRPRPPCQIP